MILEYTFRTWRGAAVIWERISDFSDPWWLSDEFCRVEPEGQGVGMRRRLHWQGAGVTALHSLSELDAADYRVVFTILQSPTSELTGARVSTRVQAITGSLSEFQMILELTNVDDGRYMDVYDAIFPWAMACMERLEAPFRPMSAQPQSRAAELPIRIASRDARRLKAS